MNHEFLFRVLSGRDIIIILLLGPEGVFRPFLPARKTLEEVYPRYAGVQPYLEIWQKKVVGTPIRVGNPRCHEVEVGSPEYPRALAEDLTRHPILNLWAYVSPRELYISLHQLAGAMGREPTPQFREELQEKQIQILVDPGGRYRVTLGQVMKVYGISSTDRILMRAGQSADFLGINVNSVSEVMRRFDLALDRDGEMLVEWGKLRRLRRVGPRKFEYNPG
jgi:hypothetical protein